VTNQSNGFKVEPSYYFDDDEYNKEVSNLLEKYWIFICPSLLVADPSSFFVFKGFSKNIVFRRSGNSSLTAFENICKHRGHQIFHDILGSSDIRCPYHGWLYQDNLELKKIPWNDKCYHLKEDKISLTELVNVREINGLVWAYFGKNPQDALFPAEKLDTELKQFSEVYSSTVAFVSIKKNFHWRLIFENLYDRVHPIFLHSESLNKVVDLTFEAYPNDFELSNTESPYLANIWQSGKKKSLADPKINENNLPEGSYINGHIFPFLHFFTPDGGNVFCFESYLPISATETQAYVFWVASKNLQKSSRHPTITRYIEGASVVLNEDFDAVESITASGILNSDFNYGAHEKSFYALKKLSEISK